ncbi:MAG: hypothetical protein U0169_03545 [Polyangiaceae bacterium]
MKRIHAFALGMVSLAVAAGSFACGDYVTDKLVERQGDETPGYPVGEFHRPGQQCSACHGQNGSAKPEFTVSGTIFSGPQSLVGVDSVEVQMTDAVGTRYIAKTNCVGNFFVKPDEWSPKFPILVRIKKGFTAVQMQSPIGREGSCAGCHKAKPLTQAESRSSMPHVQLFGGDEPPSTGSSDGGVCPVDASVPGFPAAASVSETPTDTPPESP